MSYTNVQSVPMASFLGTIISSETNPQFVLSALQLVELLVIKLPDVYQTSFIREGVVYEIEKLAEMETKAAQKAKEDEASEDVKPDLDQLAQAGPSMPSVLTRPPVPFPSVLEGSKLDFTYMRDLYEAEGGTGPMSAIWQMANKKPAGVMTIDLDSNIWRARVLGVKKIFDVEGDDKNEAKLVLDKLAALNNTLSKQAATEGELYDALKEIASQFSSAGTSLSSFELLRGGVIDGLLQFVDIDGTVSSDQRRSMLYEIFAETAPSSSASPMTILVKRLHESLGRLETFDVESAFNGVADATRPSASALSRTLRVKMTAEPGQDAPKGLNNLVLSIQAIAPLSALHDYLRPRVADSTYTTGSGISRMLAAMSAGGASVPGGSLAIPGSSAAAGSSRTLAIPGRAQAQAQAAAAASAPDLASSAPQGSLLGALSKPPPPKNNRRRSARLNAQNPETEAGASTSTAEASASASASAPAEAAQLSSSAPAPSNIPMLPMDMDFDDEYSDEEYGEEMFEDEMAAAAMSRPQEKVVNMNVASGMSLPPFETVLLMSRRFRNRSQDSRRYSGRYSQYRSSSQWICGPSSCGSHRHAQPFRSSHSSNSLVCWSRQDCSYRLPSGVFP
jgi:E3 ubiquitin-protein ligase TRIP12